MRLFWIAVAARAIFGDLEIYVLPIVGIKDKNESTTNKRCKGAWQSW